MLMVLLNTDYGIVPLQAPILALGFGLGTNMWCHKCHCEHEEWLQKAPHAIHVARVCLAQMGALETLDSQLQTPHRMCVKEH